MSSCLINSAALLWIEAVAGSNGSVDFIVGTTVPIGGILNTGGAFNTLAGFGVSAVSWSFVFWFKLCDTLLLSIVRLAAVDVGSSKVCKNSGGSFHPFSRLPFFNFWWIVLISPVFSDLSTENIYLA